MGFGSQDLRSGSLEEDTSMQIRSYKKMYKGLFVKVAIKSICQAVSPCSQESQKTPLEYLAQKTELFINIQGYKQYHESRSDSEQSREPRGTENI